MQVACGGVVTVVLVRAPVGDKLSEQTATPVAQAPAKEESLSSSLSSTIQNYQGILSIKSSSPSTPPNSLSASLSLSSSLPPLSLAREKHRQTKRRIGTSPLPPLTSSGSDYPLKTDGDESSGDESEVIVTETDISEDEQVSGHDRMLLCCIKS